jgi:hypothetical protein
MLLSGEILYIHTTWTLYVYSLSDLNSHIATYPLDDCCKTGILADNRLYLGGKNLHVFKVYASLTQPLTRINLLEAKF